jgi:hypothetical protein
MSRSAAPCSTIGLSNSVELAERFAQSRYCAMMANASLGGISMTIIARLATAAIVLVMTHSALAVPAKADHHAAMQMSATHSAMKCPAKCRQYGWPSYLLSFPPARSR